MITVDSELDVVAKYESLLQASLGTNSVYIRTKETLAELAADGELKDSDKAKVIAEVMSSINTSVVTASMQAALQWAIKEKEVALEKLELAKKLDLLDQELYVKQQQEKNLLQEHLVSQAQSLRMYGAANLNASGTDVISLVDGGKVYEETLLINQQRQNSVKEGSVLDSKLRESYAAIHKAVADTYANYGNFTYTLGADGMTAITDHTTSSHITLSRLQATIAQEQAKGYAYNAWANAATGSASMLGTAIASDLAEFGYDASGNPKTGQVLLDRVNAIMGKLQAVAPPGFL
jgi:hypothetical protein